MFHTYDIPEPKLNQSPTIIRRSARVTANIYTRITLACIAQGYPVPVFRWDRSLGGHGILSETGSNVRQEDGVLIFNKIQRSDAGRYSCHVSNTMGEDRIEIELFVEGNYVFFCWERNVFIKITVFL